MPTYKKAKIGKGWHKDSRRHSDAAVYGFSPPIIDRAATRQEQERRLPVLHRHGFHPPNDGTPAWHVYDGRKNIQVAIAPSEDSPGKYRVEIVRFSKEGEPISGRFTEELSIRSAIDSAQKFRQGYLIGKTMLVR